MNNIENAEVKSCIVIDIDELNELIYKETDGLRYTDNEDGIYIMDSQKAIESGIYDVRCGMEILTKIFDVNVTSYHNAADFPCTVYVMFKGDNDNV